MFPLSKMLAGFVRKGSLTVTDADGKTHVFGGEPGPSCKIRLTDKSLYWKLFLNPELHAAESYMDGKLIFEDGYGVRDLLAVFSANRRTLFDQPQQRALERLNKALKRALEANPIGKAQENVSRHYDLGNALYELFLDREMFYSCAYFRRGNETLEEAQLAKCRLIAAKLRLEPGMKVLDIGSGWGGLARYLARVADVEVLGVTLSKEQLALAVERTGAEGLSDRVRFELLDYRQLDRTFDRIVSVGMFEHVGVRHYAEFFGKSYRLLAPDGVMLLHSIGHMSPPNVASPFFRKYIFPGAYAPAMSEVFPVVERSHLWVTDVEFLRLHYARTLRHWQERFQARRAEAAAMYDERFCRMWEFYLLAAEEMFTGGASEVFQMQLTRRIDAVPLSRDYIVEEQARLERMERKQLAAE
ncbi:cyclopropane-fatty-acyl-phospholipid synthase family protein [Amaricoccus sp.]|uniref:SAM-dependent methyltransferase n=1 Tax=Amaricoccus sp. TaxID=1872485 RepID=UPI001B72D838|nr:cyclopropane-fatty-acyl-phospholipid synthase family protein [Amaricoccus sp.]MBP7243019.1 class I SAM-dependent methyltransferase [Amaricoccus sp.]